MGRALGGMFKWYWSIFRFILGMSFGVQTNTSVFFFKKVDKLYLLLLSEYHFGLDNPVGMGLI